MATALWDSWSRDATQVCAPGLWSYEVTSVVHKYLFDGLLTAGEAEEVLGVLFDLGVSLVEEDESLCVSAFRWATRLNHKPAYDAFYLALAERLGAELWTADRRLWRNATGVGVTWAHFMGAEEKGSAV
jgi:predicted nucleic acid-binding protein